MEDNMWIWQDVYNMICPLLAKLKKKQASKIKVEMYGNPNLNCDEAFVSLGFLKYMPFYTEKQVFSVA